MFLFIHASLISVLMEWVFIMNRMSSQGSSAAQRRRMALGVVILLLVDVIWVASSELTSVRTLSQSVSFPHLLLRGGLQYEMTQSNERGDADALSNQSALKCSWISRRWCERDIFVDVFLCCAPVSDITLPFSLPTSA